MQITDYTFANITARPFMTVGDANNKGILTEDTNYHYAKLGTHYENEYQGYSNHLIWNCAQGYLPPLEEMEKMLQKFT